MKYYVQFYAKLAKILWDKITTSLWKKAKQIYFFVQKPVLEQMDYCQPFVHKYSALFLNGLLAIWEKYRSQIDRLVQASIAISAATSTFKLSIQIMPIILSVLTILATAPILNALLPHFFFDKTILLLLLTGISLLVGYSKYRELINRATLDEDIHKNKKVIKKLKTRVHRLEEALKQRRQFTPASHHRFSIRHQRSPYKNLVPAPSLLLKKK